MLADSMTQQGGGGGRGVRREGSYVVLLALLNHVISCLPTGCEPRLPGRGEWCPLYKIEVRDFPGRPVVKTSPSSAGGSGSIPGRGAKILRATPGKNQNINQKQYCNKFNKDFKKKLR